MTSAKEAGLVTEGRSLGERWQINERLLALRPVVADVFGLPVYVGSTSSFCDFFCKHFEKLRGLGACIASPDSYVIVKAHRDASYDAAMRRFFLCLPDGKPLVHMARRTHPVAGRCRGPDNMKELIKRTSGLPVKHYFLGGSEAVLARVCERAKKEWGNPNIVGALSPPYVRDWRAYDYAGIAERVRASGADVLWVALGTPKQDLFAAEMASRVALTGIFPVGAAFNFHAGAVREAPLWIRHAWIPIEWLYRILQEPRRLMGRYAYTVLWFFYYLLRALLTGKRRRLS